MRPDSDLADLRNLLVALEPFLDQLVIVGGWAHRLYRFLDVVQVPGYDPVFTTDTDVAIPEDAVVPQNGILDRLRASGFSEEFLGEDQPPVTHYRVTDKKSGFYAEFLTPVARRRRKAIPDATVIGGVVAQTLRNLDILLIDPWTVRVTDGDRAALTVRVPNPVSYVVQKLVILKNRPAQDRAKDILYVHDTLELFGAHLDVLSRTWRVAVRPAMESLTKEVVTLATKYFADVTDDIRRACSMAVARQLDPETLRLRCQVGLATVLSAEWRSGRR